MTELEKENAAYESPEYRGCRVIGFYGKNGVGLIEVRKLAELLLSSEVPAYKIWNCHAHYDELIDTVLGDGAEYQQKRGDL